MAEPALITWGIDHHRTPVAIRERLAVRGLEAEDLARLCAGLPGVSEVLVLSTCNRLECYLAGEVAEEAVSRAIAEARAIEPALLATHRYWHRGEAAVRHLFRVVCGLESLVLGEDQIVHQIKEAYEAARNGALVGPVLHPLFQRALGVGKEVRSETAIGRHKLSTASVAVDLARHVHGDLAAAKLLVIGAGEIAQLTMRYLLEQGVRHVSVINRTQERAIALSKDTPARVYAWEQLVEALSDHDTVISSTAAAHAVVSEAEVRLARRRQRGALLLIDLAVPRDIDPQVAGLADVYLYNIDNLESVVAANRLARSDEVAAATAVVDANVRAYLEATRPAGQQLAREVTTYFRDVVAAEEARLAAKLALTDDARRADLRYGLERVANKLQHQLLSYLRAHAHDAEAERSIRALLNLPGGADLAAAASSPTSAAERPDPSAAPLGVAVQPEPAPPRR